MQYEDSFRTVRNSLWHRLIRTPKRRWGTVAKPLADAINEAFKMIMCIDEDLVKGTKTAPQIRYDRIVKAQERIKAIERPLWVYWNIGGDAEEPGIKLWKERSRAHLCALINETILKQLHDMQTESSKYDPKTDKGMITLRYYTEAEISKAQFLTVIRELHRMTHGKVVRLSTFSRDAEGCLLLQFIDTAWYCAVSGNQLSLDNPEERAERKKMFSEAISALYKAQRPLFNLFSIGSYSDSEIKDWAHLLNEATRLLQAVQKSDSRRAA